MKSVVIDGVKYVPEVDPHAEFRAAQKDGKAIQLRYCASSEWRDVDYMLNFTEPPECYRIKPEKKPDVVMFTPMNLEGAETNDVMFTHARDIECDQLKLTFDGETGKLKSAEVL